MRHFSAGNTLWQLLVSRSVYSFTYFESLQYLAEIKFCSTRSFRSILPKSPRIFNEHSAEYKVYVLILLFFNKGNIRLYFKIFASWLTQAKRQSGCKHVFFIKEWGDQILAFNFSRNFIEKREDCGRIDLRERIL